MDDLLQKLPPNGRTMFSLAVCFFLAFVGIYFGHFYFTDRNTFHGDQLIQTLLRANLDADAIEKILKARRPIGKPELYPSPVPARDKPQPTNDVSPERQIRQYKQSLAEASTKTQLQKRVSTLTAQLNEARRAEGELCDHVAHLTNELAMSRQQLANANRIADHWLHSMHQHRNEAMSLRHDTALLRAKFSELARQNVQLRADLHELRRQTEIPSKVAQLVSSGGRQRRTLRSRVREELLDRAKSEGCMLSECKSTPAHARSLRRAVASGSFERFYRNDGKATVLVSIWIDRRSRRLLYTIDRHQSG